MEINIPRVWWTRLSYALAGLIWVLAAGFAIPVFEYLRQLIDGDFIHSVLINSYRWVSICMLFATIFAVWDGYESFLLPKAFKFKRVLWAFSVTAFALWYFKTSINLSSASVVKEICFQ